VTGPLFVGLHKFFDQVDDAAEFYGDLIAEGAVHISVARSGGEECPLAVADGNAHVKLVTRAIHIWT
jgi:hypothetical protein